MTMSTTRLFGTMLLSSSLLLLLLSLFSSSAVTSAAPVSSQSTASSINEEEKITTMIDPSAHRSLLGLHDKKSSPIDPSWTDQRVPRPISEAMDQQQHQQRGNLPKTNVLDAELFLPLKVSLDDDEKTTMTATATRTHSPQIKQESSTSNHNHIRRHDEDGRRRRRRDSSVLEDFSPPSPSPTVTPPTPTYDLYIQNRFRNSTVSSVCDGDCDLTSPTTADCFTFQIYYLEDFCIPLSDGGSFKLTSDFNNANRVCQSTYSFSDTCDGTGLTPDPDDFDGYSFCKVDWPIRECIDGDEEMIVYEDWCISSEFLTDENSGIYTTPLIEIDGYENEVACQADIEPLTRIVLDDPTLCHSVGVTLANGTIVRGGRLNYCDGDRLVVSFFADEECTQVLDETSGEPLIEAYPPVIHYNDCVRQSNDFVTKATCGQQPKRYCKSVSENIGASISPAATQILTQITDAQFIPSPTPVASLPPEPAVDLYVFKQDYALLNRSEFDADIVFTQENDPFDECPVCEAEDVVVGDCTPYRSYFVQGECLRTGDNPARLFQGDDTAVCRMFYTGSEQIDRDACEVVTDPCSGLYQYDTCEDGKETLRLEDWCVKPSPDGGGQPAGAEYADYTIPFFKVTRYSDLVDCESGLLGRQTYVFADPNFCHRASVYVNGIRQVGSFTAVCDAGEFKVSIYSDPECSIQDPGLLQTNLLRTESCTLQESDMSYWTASCDSPEYYCKDVYSFPGFGTQLNL